MFHNIVFVVPALEWETFLTLARLLSLTTALALGAKQ